MKELTDYDVDYFMGLFAIEDMEYQLEQTPEMDDPTLAEMTETAKQLCRPGYGILATDESTGHGN